MIRQAIGKELVPPEENFRWRGGEITRLEGFTDAVFALAVTLLIVSLEVPRTFSQLAQTMKGFVPFAVCFGSLAHVWHRHYVYSRRYGLQTAYAVFLNSVLLFVVLFYVYPLKFLFALSLGALFGTTTGPELAAMIELRQVPALVAVFSLGYTAVFAVFALLYLYAYGKRRELDLNEYEALRTRNSTITYVVVAAVGVLVAITAQLLPVQLSFFSLFLFLLNNVYGLISRPIFRKQERAALERVRAASNAISVA
jgi:uncharacterized membrane protein